MVTKRYYDSYWEGEDGWFPVASLSEKLSKTFEKFVTDETTVLDIGCGDGEHYGKYLCRRAQKYFGVDISLEAVEKAKANGITAILWAAGEMLPFEDNSFDTLLCIEVLEHLFEPASLLKECHRVLR
ncbi:MAG: class I SAM-dependent methyltransferase [Candidatus Edwardsbacteria bacterium]